MGKKLLITEKPSVAMEFAKALKINTNRKNGYLESENWIITWCVGHLVTMSYPEVYDEKYKGWSAESIYDELVLNIRKNSRLNTLRGYTLVDN